MHQAVFETVAASPLHLSMAELEAAFLALPQPPKDLGRLALIVCRQRERTDPGALTSENLNNRSGVSEERRQFAI